MSKKPKPNQMYQELAAHYAVERGSKTTQEFMAAVKKAAGSPNDSIEVIYDRWKNPPKTIDVKPNSGNGNNSGVATSSGSGGRTPVAHSSKSSDEEVHTLRPSEVVTVHVHAPQASPSQVVQQRAELVPRVASWCQTMALGVVVGVLISRHVLRFMGFN